MATRSTRVPCRSQVTWIVFYLNLPIQVERTSTIRTHNVNAFVHRTNRLSLVQAKLSMFNIPMEYEQHRLTMLISNTLVSNIIVIF
jgi:hypothetical protein